GAAPLSRRDQTLAACARTLIRLPGARKSAAGNAGCGAARREFRPRPRVLLRRARRGRCVPRAVRGEAGRGAWGPAPPRRGGGWDAVTGLGGGPGGGGARLEPRGILS